jgi:glycine/D-amino acid oxidase-like deaminating enzyme
MNSYLQSNPAGIHDPGIYHNPLGSLNVLQAGMLDMKKLVLLCRQYFEQNQILIRSAVNPAEVIFSTGHIIWHNIRARMLILCNGNGINQWPQCKTLRMFPSHGEVMEIRANLPGDRIVSKGAFIIPAGKGFFRAGATYSFRLKHSFPTRSGETELKMKINTMIRIPWEMCAHKAGIRPSTFDRRPFIGIHPNEPRLGVFNGFGAKGASLVPCLAGYMTRHLHNSAPLPPECDIGRTKAFL